MTETGGGAPEEHRFDLSAGDLSLDFANTLDDRTSGAGERLTCYADLLAWGRQAGLVDDLRALDLSRSAIEDPGEAWSALERGVELRESLYRVFAALARGAEPAGSDTATLNRFLGRALPHLALEREKEAFDWTWRGRALDQMLWAVARSAAELLTSKGASRVRECASDTCTWLFLDRSRGGRRKWCDMKTCGNRNKARRHYARRRARDHAAPPAGRRPGAHAVREPKDTRERGAQRAGGRIGSGDER